MLLLTTMVHVRRARLPQTQTVASIILSFKQASSSIRPERRTINGQYAQRGNALRGAVSCVRVAEHADCIYLDLADEHWRAVEIGADGWRVLDRPPVRFRRAPGMLPFPVPERGGSIEALRSFLNLSSQNDFVLVVAWLLAALRPAGPYPLLTITGEQGSAKTFLSKLLRALVDPNVAAVRALPREERELMIAANNGHVLAFDNLSGLSPWLSDALCRLASGGSFAVRRLYTNDEEVLFKAARPTLLWDRGCHWSLRSGRPRDFYDVRTYRRGAAAF